MNILHVASEYPPQQVFGLGRYVCDLSRELVRQGHGVHVLTNSVGGPGGDAIDEGVHVHRVEFPPPPKPPDPGGPIMAFNLHLQQRALSLGKEALGDPEVVVSHDWLAAVAASRLARRWAVPHVWTVHDTVFGKRFGKITDPEDHLAFHLERWAAQSADLVLGNSRAICRELSKTYGGREETLALLHCAIDPARFSVTTPRTRLDAFRSVFAEPDELLVTFSGRLDLEKGLDTLINAFALLLKTVPRAKLAVVGRGRLQPLVEDHIRKLGLEHAVRLYGYLEGEVLAHFYHVSDIQVCPSYYEPFGLVAVEAMVAGTPTVVSETGGLLDIVTDPGIGRTFPVRDVQGLARTLEELANDPELRKRLGEAGRRHALEYFSWSKRAGQAVALYGRVLPERN